MNALKLVALDEQDLRIISAHVQDAVLKVGDLQMHARGRRFILEMNRFVWEKKRRFFRPVGERRRAVLHFERVRSVKAIGLNRSRPDDVLNLLAIIFEAGEAPSGTIVLTFSGGAALRLEVECIEAQLADLGAAWETPSRPSHV